jgi:hypothetical protein
MAKARKLVLHIGMHKTGSSSIQNSFATFESSTTAYLPLWGGPNHSIAYNTLFRSNPFSYYVHVQKKRDRLQVKRLQSKLRLDISSFLASSAANTILSSGEGLTNLSPKELVNLKSFFEPYFSEIHILGYVRPPISFMTSALQQVVRNIICKPIAPEDLYPNYRNTFEKFFNVFGDSHVTVRPFASKFLHNGDVVQDFANFNNVELEPSNIVVSNISMGVEPLSILYSLISDDTLVRALTSTPGSRELLISVLQGFGQTKISLSSDLVKPVLDANQEDLDWISEKLQMNIVDNPREEGFQLHSLDELFSIAKDQYPKLIEAIGKRSATFLPSSRTVSLATALLESIHSDIQVQG